MSGRLYSTGLQSHHAMARQSLFCLGLLVTLMVTASHSHRWIYGEQGNLPLKLEDTDLESVGRRIVHSIIQLLIKSQANNVKLRNLLSIHT